MRISDWSSDVCSSDLITAAPQPFGDVVLARKDAPSSYHLAVTVDDAAQAITDVVRGEDLFAATHIHRLLQALLDLPSPVYHHHPLITDASGHPHRRDLRRGDPTPGPTRPEERRVGKECVSTWK